MNSMAPTSGPKITVLGVGNILLRDEGVGVRTAEYIIKNKLLSSNIEIIDGGTAGTALIPIVKDADYLIIIDAVKGSGKPCDLYRFTIDDLPLIVKQKRSLHEVNLQEVFSILNLLGENVPETVIIGIRPKEVSCGTGLSREIESVVPKAAFMVVKEVEHILHSHRLKMLNFFILTSNL